MRGESIEKDRMAKARLGRGRLRPSKGAGAEAPRTQRAPAVCRKEKAETESRE